MFTTSAYAQSATTGGGDFVQLLLPLVVVFAIIYFMIIRPQQKRQREHRMMLDALRRGDEVVTQGGLIGKIVKVHDEHIDIDIADNTRVSVIKTMIVTIRNSASNTKGAKNTKRAKKE